MKLKYLLFILLAVSLCGTANAQFNPEDPSEPGNKYRLTLTCSPEGTGTVYGSGSYSKGTEVYISAYPKSGYEFSCWKNGEDVISTSSSLDYIMPNVNTTLTAYFEKEGSGSFNPVDPDEPNSSGNGGNNDGTYHTLTIVKEPTKGAQLNHEGEVRLREGETIYLYANLANGYEMDGWYINDKIQSIQTSFSYTMWNHDETLTVKFNYNPIDPTDPGSSENKEFILITSQEQLEDYANIEEFPRSVRIMGPDITSLQSLSRMKKIKGDLRIENTSLTSLEGLDNLTEVTGKLMVLHNRLLSTMEGIYSWDGIYYVLIEGNPQLVNYCSMTEYALKGERAYGEIRENGYNPTFEDILNGFCSKNEDIFRVTACEVIRQLDFLHFSITFSNEPETYADINSLIEIKGISGNLNVTSFLKNNLTYDLFTSLPSKADNYVLTVSKDIQDIFGRKLNQNGNSFEGEDEDSFTETYPFNSNELYVVNQAPLDGVIGERGYTEVAFNAQLKENLKSSDIKLYAPSGSLVAIESVEYIDTVSPIRYRVNYSPLTEDGRYTFNVLSSAIQSVDGKKMICDFQSYIDLPCVNFQPTEIVLDEQWNTGEKKTITYRVSNNGSKNAIGSISDVIYISPTDAWNSEAIEIYRGSNEISASSHGEFSRTLEVQIPNNLIDGQYFVILKTNVSQSIKEASYKDNVSVSSPIKISVPQLTADNGNFILGRGKSKIFRLPAMIDSNIEIIDSNGTANMYMGYYSYPDITTNPKHGSITILSSDGSSNCYLVVSNNPKSVQKDQECRLSLRQFALDIPTVGRSEIIKYGTAWLPLEITGCAYIPQIYLQSKDGQKYECIEVQAKSETSFYAKFEMSEIPTGSYHIYVDCNGITGLKEQAVSVIEGQPTYSIKSKLVLPETSRIGSTITAYIDYYNAGNVDAPIPLFVLSGQKGSTYILPDGASYAEEAHILGLNPNGIINTVLPGESARIAIDITIPNEKINTADYKLNTIALGADGMEEPFYLQWLDIDPEYIIGEYSETEWSEYCNELKLRTGETWNDFLRNLSNICSEYYTIGQFNYDARLIYSLLIADRPTTVSKEEHKNVVTRSYDIKPTIEPGSIYVWRNNSWLPLVEPQYDIEYDVSYSGVETKRYVFKEWKRTSNCTALSSSKVYFISHGMNNYHTQDWISDMARALASKRDGIVLCVDWGYWSSAGGPIPSVSAGYIDQAVNRTYEALNVAFNNDKSSKVNLNRFHLIGHSHGAHLCGRLSKKYGIKAKRITALDASEELSHMTGSRTQWNASYIDYYKSSVTCGTEYLVGDDNFILASGDEKFTSTGIKIWEDIARHGYACTWFTSTINNSDRVDVGYSWENKRGKYKLFANHQGWDGVINGPKLIIEGLTNFYDDHTVWNYTSPWYTNSGAKTSEWLFKYSFCDVINYVAYDIDTSEEIQCGTNVDIKCSMKNEIDNFTIPQRERDYTLFTSVTNSLYVSSFGKDNYSMSKDKNGVYYAKISNPIYYLNSNSINIIPSGGINADAKDITFKINISSKIWAQIAGTEKDEGSIERYLWLVSGLPQQGNGQSFLDNPTELSFWKGEMDPTDNIKIVKVTLKNPNLACDAGSNRTITLKKGQKSTDVSLSGIVERDNGKKLSYYWEKARNVFGTNIESSINLGVGKHKLTFRIKAENQAKMHSRSTSASETEAEDDIIITVKPYTPGDEDDESTSTASSWDPNEKVGTAGVGDNNCILPSESIDYTIYFENDAEKATLAAQKVTVYDVLDEAFDLSTFEFTGAEVSNTEIEIPAGLSEYSSLTDLRPNNNLLLKTDLKLDIDTRTVIAEFSSIDPETGEFTKDVWAGFLPPNDDNHSGEGHFSYRVKLKDEVADEYNVRNIADIYFDYNDCISTNETSHYIDSSTPISAVILSDTESHQKTITVSWEGHDLSGIKWYDIYVSDNGGEYSLWKQETSETHADFEGEWGHTYSFYSIATDLLGHVEPVKSHPDATVVFEENGSGIDEVSATDNDTIISIYPAIPSINEPCTIRLKEGVSRRNELRIFDMSGRLQAVFRNINASINYTFNQTGVHVMSFSDDKNPKTNEVIKIWVK